LGGGNPKSLIIPGTVGIVMGSFMGYLLYRCSGTLNFKSFFIGSSIVLFIIAAGLVVNASAEFEEFYYDNVVNHNVEGANEGVNEDEPMEETGGFQTIPSPMVLWNVCQWGDEEVYPFFQVMRTLVGWRCRPTLVTTLSYVGYWFIVILIALIQRFKDFNKR
jgi:FTR1 family protein